MSDRDLATTPRRGGRGRAAAFLATTALVTAGLAAATLPAQATPVTVGYRDFSYGSVSAPTGQKPESKLWYTQDDVWWGSMFDTATKHWEIYRFDASSQSWSTTGVSIDTRTPTEADALYDKATSKLYVVSHVKDTGKAADLSIKFEQYTYSSGTWTVDAGFPVNIATVNPETTVLDRDSTGTVWVTWTEPNGAAGRRVEIAHSLADTRHWSAPYGLPGTTHAGNLGTDEIATLVAFHQQIGVMWGNENDGTLSFDSHVDGAADTSWTSVVLCDQTTFGNPKCPDDHFNIKSLDADGTGRIFALVKTGLDDLSSTPPSAPLEIMWEYNPAQSANNGWARSTVWTVGDNMTRAITLLDSSTQEIYAFAPPCCNGGTVYMKKASYSTDDPQWASGRGTPFIQSSTDVNMNNPTSTKQSVNDASGLLVLVSADHTKFYLHNYLPLGAGDTTPPNVTAQSPLDGATDVPASTSVRATFSEAVDPATVDGGSFTLSGPGSTPVSATVTYDAGQKTATLQPSSALADGVTYTANVTGVKDTAGNVMTQPSTWSFSTATGGGPPAITDLGEVGRSSSSTSGLTLSIQTTQAVPAGSTVVVGLGYAGAATVTAKVTDSAGDTWTVDRRTANASTGTTSAVASTRTAAGLSSGATITVTLSAKVATRIAVGYAYTGITGTAASTGAFGTSKTPNSGAVAAAAGNLLFAVTMYNNAAVTHSPGSGITELAEVAAGAKKLAVDEQAVTAAGSRADSGLLSASVRWTDSAVLYD